MYCVSLPATKVVGPIILLTGYRNWWEPRRSHRMVHLPYVQLNLQLRRNSPACGASFDNPDLGSCGWVSLVCSALGDGNMPKISHQHFLSISDFTLAFTYNSTCGWIDK
jgi:hypothetical protein